MKEEDSDTSLGERTSRFAGSVSVPVGEGVSDRLLPPLAPRPHHKGKGYRRSSRGGDRMSDLAERKVRRASPDTAYGSGRNAFEASRRGTELVSPWRVRRRGTRTKERVTDHRLTAADFQTPREYFELGPPRSSRSKAPTPAPPNASTLRSCCWSRPQGADRSTRRATSSTMHAWWRWRTAQRSLRATLSRRNDLVLSVR